MAKVVLINPNFQNRVKAIAQTSVGPPLGLAYLAANLQRHGHRVSIIDANAYSLNTSQILKRALSYKPDVVGLTSVTPTIGDVASLCSRIKRESKGITTVVGGVHATVRPVETMQENSNIDFIVRGEGEHSLVAFLSVSNPEMYQAVPGLVYRDFARNAIKVNECALIRNLDELPFPLRSILPMNRYYSFESGRFTTIIAMRGCPAPCIYCSVNALFGKKIRFRNPMHVIEEMKLCYQDYNIRYFSFLDDTFTFEESWVRDFCRLLMRTSLHKRIRWNCLTRPDTVNEGLLLVMKQAGCSRIEMGIESGSETILNTIKKHIKKKTIQEAFRAARHVGLSTMGFVILNNPGDNRTTFAATKEIVRDIDPDYLQVSFATPYPGTELYSLAKQRDLLKTTEWSEYIFLNKVILRNPRLSEAELISQYQEINRTFYIRPAFLWRMLRFILSGRIHPGICLRTIVNGIQRIIRGEKYSVGQ